MTRKDTILIAVFVNAALLVALFITAIRGKNEPFADATEQKLAEVAPLVLAEPEKKSTKEASSEIDQVLREFSEKKEIAVQEKPVPKIDFAKELEAITSAVTTTSHREEVRKEKGTLEVTVKKGDFLEKIAREHQCKVEEILSLNHLSNTVLQIGQVLKIPAKGKSAPIKAASSSSFQEDVYTVKQGDNPWTIAVKNHMKVDELLKLNNLNDEKARRLKPGDKLKIRK